MSFEYHVAVNGEREGPLTQYEIHNRIKAGELKPEVLGWRKGNESWSPLGELEEFQGAFQEVAQMPPPLPEGLAQGEEGEVSENQDVAVAPEQPDAESVPSGYVAPAPEGEMEPIRIWPRVLARLVDSIIFFLAIILFFSALAPQVLMGLGQFAYLIVVALAFVLEAGLLCSFGTTPGKAMMGITIRSEQGTILSFGAALRRSLLVWLRGVGLGHPLLAIILIALAYFEIRKRGNVLWDADQRLQISYRDPKPLSIAASGMIVVGFFLMMVQGYHFMVDAIRSGKLDLPDGIELPPALQQLRDEGQQDDSEEDAYKENPII